ncbi:MAG: Tm-1-like ATP-binding domain-containing protein [Rhodospirillaceae bacterium]|jgi:uncharacterized protein (UPF0261 family)|nr:Tm-1-like ATP-binding domain-containing protein [Rhodospirillaceae bacterium]MBT5945476.1 Tm-1-like ATP-binding domain-containing protein [Rhodospirillaceae bacterium]MBT6404206.1 Tm-1-like ATP-binding domain-containing protein [Rhodospirillaceae bacterium]MBT6535149.1 Tm-1-like ATP-binding domain-containing protein [Rhodospirillaceae bacterium]MBT7361542.1 Tm-1-like ATP-binding domain-containing protein [Rhodospirillaceae bacterium]
MSAAKPTVAILVTMDTKAPEALFVASCLEKAGTTPWIVDLSLMPHESTGADMTGGDVAEAGGHSWDDLAKMDRRAASDAMLEGAIKVVRGRFDDGQLEGAIGLGGANGTTMACAIMRALPYLVPKAMVSAVAATAAVQWYVAEADIAMHASIGDVALNRITKAAMENAAVGVAAAACNRASKAAETEDHPPLVAISSFGGTAGCVDRAQALLEAEGFEVILFHASGIGGRALERLAREGELAGVLDITTHELTDFVTNGVYDAGGERLTGAGAMGLPQVVVPGAIDHSNFWAGQAPERYRDREFFQYNAQNLLMRTNGEEMAELGRAFAERLNAAKGPVRVLIPLEGYSEHTKRKTYDLAENELGAWKQPETDRMFSQTLKENLTTGTVEELPCHINEAAFADACVAAFLEVIGSAPGGTRTSGAA